MIKIHDTHEDKVIKSSVSSAITNYEYALENLYPLIDKFSQQRKVQSKSFYSRLRKDIVAGCIVPPITIAFTSNSGEIDLKTKSIQEFVNNNIKDGYILDGMQRLNTLHSASEDDGFDKTRPLPLNIIITSNYDFLIYRMITLNNGQKPMTARHQVEMLTGGLIDYSGLNNIDVATEKDAQGKRPAKFTFKQSDIAEAYMAYLSENLHNSNSKIIQSKLDEILVNKVMSSNISENASSFDELLKTVDRLCENEHAKSWLYLGNNLIGFSVAYRKNPTPLQNVSPENYGEACQTFEAAFNAINQSQVNVGKVRRDLSFGFNNRIDDFVSEDESFFIDQFNEMTIS